MFENRCRTTPEPVPVNASDPDSLLVWDAVPLEEWPKLCNVDENNCPEGSWCGAPY